MAADDKDVQSGAGAEKPATVVKNVAPDAKERVTDPASKAKKLGLVVAGILVLGLAVDAVQKTRRQEAKSEEKEKAAQKELDKKMAAEAEKLAEAQTGKVIDFDKLQREAAEKLKREQEAKAAAEEAKRLREAREKARKQAEKKAAPPENEDEILAQFMLQERQRGLNAVRNGIAFRSVRTASQSTQGQQGQQGQQVQQPGAQGRPGVAQSPMAPGARPVGVAAPGTPAANAELLRQTIAAQQQREAAGGGGSTGAAASDVGSGPIVGETASARMARGQNPGGSPDEGVLSIGTVLSGVTDTDFNSDFPGSWRGLLVRDVYDHQRRMVLLPRGTRIVGRVLAPTSVNQAIQSKMAMSVNWAIRPDGSKVNFSKASVLDQEGIAAIEGDVNYHWLWQLFGVGAYAVLNYGDAAAQRYANEGLPENATVINNSSRQTQTIAERFVSRYLNLVPTITVKAGTPFKLFVEDEIYASNWEPVDGDFGDRRRFAGSSR